MGLPCSASNAAVSFIHSQIPELDLTVLLQYHPRSCSPGTSWTTLRFGLDLTLGKGHKWDGYRLSVSWNQGVPNLLTRSSFHSSPLTSGTLCSPSEPLRILPYSHSSVATLIHPWRRCIPLRAELWQQIHPMMVELHHYITASPCPGHKDFNARWNSSL